MIIFLKPSESKTKSLKLMKNQKQKVQNENLENNSQIILSETKSKLNQKRMFNKIRKLNVRIFFRKTSKKF